MLWFFLIFSTFSWGMAEIFYKKGNTADEKYAHLKTTMFVGFFFGIYSLIILFTQGVSLSYFPSNFLRYMPVALCYIVSMTCSYFGVRYVEESIADPIENTSCAVVPILCAIFLHQELNAQMIIAIILVVVGILGAGIFDKSGKENRTKKYGKKLAIVSIAMPFCYMILDAIGTFFDIYYTDSAETSVLVGVTEDNLEHTANCCYELTFFIASIFILIYLKRKNVKIFDIFSSDTSSSETSSNETSLSVSSKGFSIKNIANQKNKILAAIFETAGQATYLFSLSEGTGIAAVILGAGTIIISFTLSRILLKEKLTLTQYFFIALIFAGIITISFAG